MMIDYFENNMAASSMTVILLAIFVTAHLAHGLYEDQAGLFDWKQDYIGKVKDFHWEQAPSAGKKVLVATEKNVIASLNANDGSIAWRRIFEPSVRGRIDAFLHQGNALVSVHAGGEFVRSWEVPSGRLYWEKSLSTDVDSWATGFFLGKDGKADEVIVTTSSTMHCLNMANGHEEWKTELPNSDTVERWYVQERDDSFIAIGITPGQRVTVVTISLEGKVKQHKNVPAPWIAIDTSCIVLEDGKNFVCYSPQSKSLQLLSLDNVNVFKPTDLQMLDVPVSSVSQIESVVPELGSTILFRSSPERLVLMSLTSQQSFSVHKTLDKTYAAQVVGHGDKSILLTLSRAEAESLALTATDLKAGTEITDLSQTLQYAHYHGSPTKMYPFVFNKKKEPSPGCKLIFASQDYSLHFAQKGKSPWRREEAMSYILSVQMVDLPVSENQAKFEDEFGAKEEDIFAMFIKRLKAQFSQLKGMALTLTARLLGQHQHYSRSMDAIEEEEPEEEDLIRDDFNLHKIIVVATAAGKIYGIRSHTGKIAWQQFVPDLTPFHRYDKDKLILVVQRTTAHFPHEPQCTVVGVSKKTGNGLLVSFNPVTGAMLAGHQGQGYDLGYKVIQADMLSDMDADFLKGIILIDEKVKPHVYPPTSATALYESEMTHFFHLMVPETGIMTGYRLMPSKDGSINIEEVWNLDLQKSQQTVTGVYGKRAIEHVHSQGRVLGDRSVLYKYLNPNLVVVVAEGEEQAQAAVNKGPTPFYSVYLIDGVSGHIVYHHTHKRSKGPINVIHAENWVVYTYFSEKHRRNEIAVLEMYEGKEQSNSTAFSSFSPPPQPLVMRQGYIFPGKIFAMETTVTEKGIASKNIIIALKLGGVLSLPKALLDPRRPVIPTQETMEEGTIPYVPEIPLSTEAMINYNQSMFNVDGVFTAPAGLESTSLVFVYGVDVFYTRVMPSRMFDVLKEDFDYLFISCVLGAMILLSIITQKLAARRALNRAWK